MNTLVKIALGVVLALIGSRIYTIWNLLNFGRVVYNHAPGPCRLVDGVVHGSEDIQTTSDGKAFITSGMKNYMNYADPTFYDRSGKIFLFDFAQPEAGVTELTIIGDCDVSDWAPHGISLLEDEKGTVFVFVVVHRPSGDSIEKFTYVADDGVLKHQKTYKDETHMRLLNDVLAIGENSFYFTNYQKYQGLWEGLLGIHKGSVMLYDGQEYNMVADGFRGTNGVNKSPDGRYLYVAHATDMTVYKRNENNQLSFVRQIALHTSSDNIDVDKITGDVWIGCHPILYKALKYLTNPTEEAPSQVLRLKMKDGDVTSITEVYVDDGVILKGSTVAVRHKMALLVGTVHDKLLHCELKYV